MWIDTVLTTSELTRYDYFHYFRSIDVDPQILTTTRHFQTHPHVIESAVARHHPTPRGRRHVRRDLLVTLRPRVAQRTQARPVHETRAALEAVARHGRHIAGVAHLAAAALVAERTAAVERPVGCDTRPAVRTRLAAVGSDQAELRRAELDLREADAPRLHADPEHAMRCRGVQHRGQIGVVRGAVGEPPGRACVHREQATVPDRIRRRVRAAERAGMAAEAVFQPTAPVVDGVVERVESGLVAERHAVVLGVVGRAVPPKGHLDSQLRLVVSRQPVQVVEAEPERVAGAEAALVFGPVAVEIDVFAA